MNLRRRIVLLVFQTRSVLMGYSRRMESNNRQVFSSLHTNGLWIFGNQKPPSSSGLLRKVTIFRRECLGTFITLRSVSLLGCVRLQILSDFLPKVFLSLPLNKSVGAEIKMDLLTLADTKYHRLPQRLRISGLVVTIWP